MKLESGVRDFAMRAVICALVVFGMLLPSVVMCQGEKLAVEEAGGGRNTVTESGREDIHPIILYAVWKFVEGIGWMIIGYELKHMWDYVFDNDLPKMVEDTPNYPDCPIGGWQSGEA
jgi:hypothetical protein